MFDTGRWPDPGRLAEDQLVEAIAAAGRLSAALAGWHASAIAELDRRAQSEHPDFPEAAVPQLAVALRCSENAAHNRLELARSLTERLPETHKALSAGEISLGHVHVLDDRLGSLSDEDARRVEAALVEPARRLTPAQLSRLARRAAAACQPQELAAADEPGPAHRVAFDDEQHTLWAQLSATCYATLRRALHELAGADRTDRRPYELRLHDALEELALTALPAAPPPAVRGARAGLQLIVDLPTLTGLTDAPAHLGDATPIPAATARRLACDSWLTPLLVDTDGRLLHLGRARRFPDARLLRHLIARDQTCQFPGCTRPAHRCEAHHAIAWYHGGTTDPINCLMICPRHHRAVHTGGWKINRHPDETTSWLTPTGQHLHTHPPRYPVSPRPG